MDIRMNGTGTLDSPEDFQMLVERHARPLFRLAYRMSGSQSDAEDLVQETFLRAWRQRDKFDGRAAFGTWLHRICANCSLDLLRSRNRRQEKQVTGADENDNPMERVAAVEPSPERLALSGQISGILGPAMDELTEMERAAFILRHYEGMSTDEIAEALGVAPGAAKHSVFRAVQKLRRALEPAMKVGI